MDFELLLKFMVYFPDYLSALSRTLLRFFGQPLSKQLYTSLVVNLIGQRSPDVIGRLSVSRDIIGCEDCKK